MKIYSTEKFLLSLFTLASVYAHMLQADSYAHTIFVPRQLAYNPLYEDGLVFDEYAHLDGLFLLSIKPIYTQTVGSSIQRYFNINHACSMNVQENGSGVIDSLWFQVISPASTYYSSTLSYKPIQKTYGAMLYLAWLLPGDLALTFNTAFVRRENSMRPCETNIASSNIGQVPGLGTLTQAFTNPEMKYGKICGTRSKGGVDDLQIKLLKNFRLCDDRSLFVDIYALAGVPTGHGSKAVYLFEPLVGSKHAQLGLGFNAEKSWDFEMFDSMCDRFSLYGECKWRYAFTAKETRSFDMTPNGQWSRYLLFTTPAGNANPFPAINDLTFKAYVTPRNSFDLLVASHVQVSKCNVEFGYNFWYRQAEKVCPCIHLTQVGIADLVGIAQLTNTTPVTVTTSSNATISQGVYPNTYQMPRDAAYTLVTAENINTLSGAQPTSCSNAIFGSLGYHDDWLHLGINTSYEHAANKNTASVVSVWANIDINF